MSDLATWAERQFRVVEQDGTSVALVKLITAHDGEVWETWGPPWGTPEEWSGGAEAYLRSLEGQWPNRGVAVVFVALSASGDVLSRFPATVHGKNKQGGSAPWNTEQAAVAMIVDNIALSMEKFQRLINTQLDSARRNAETNAVVMFQQSELIRLMRQNQALDEGERGEPDVLSKLIAEHGGDFVEIAKLMLKHSSPKAPKSNGTIVPKSKE